MDVDGWGALSWISYLLFKINLPSCCIFPPTSVYEKSEGILRLRKHIAVLTTNIERGEILP